MRSTERCCLRAVAMIVFSALIALPAAATDFEEVYQICYEYVANNPDDPEWDLACQEAIEELSGQEIPEPPVVGDPVGPPSGPFPIEETAIPAGPHDGDLDAIVQALQSGPADIIVEFEVSAVRDAIHARAAAEEQLFLSDALLAEKSVEYARIKAAGLAGVIGVVICAIT